MSRWLMLLPLIICHSLGAKELTVGVENIDYKPIYSMESGSYQGYGRELLDQFSAKSGHKLNYVPLPLKRLYSDFLGGSLDLKFPDNPYWSKHLRKGITVHYSDSTLEYIDGTLVKPDRVGKGKENLKRLEVIRGFTPWAYGDDFKNNVVNLQETTKLSQVMQLADSDRVDGVFFNILVARYFLRHTPGFKENTVVFDPALPYSQDHYSVATLKHQDVILEFNAFLKAEAQWVADLRKKYELDL
ncbi:MAG: transporter substrate-binding domain-containing protein [Pseudomonadales bacterium]|nr:transporter substrate-binding domain-containing protein [Pseudomonadales bacterium]